MYLLPRHIARQLWPKKNENKMEWARSKGCCSVRVSIPRVLGAHGLQITFRSYVALSLSGPRVATPPVVHIVDERLRELELC